jgi:putative endopeptidase
MRRSLLVLAGLVLAGCAVAANIQASGPKPAIGAWGVDLTAMDAAVKPGDDFYDFVNGSWLKRAAVPSDRASIGSFDSLRTLSETRMKEIVAGLDAKPDKELTDEERKLRDLYSAFVDVKQIEDRGLAPVKNDLGAIAAIKTHEDAARVMGSVRLGTESVFDIHIGVNEKNPDQYAVDLSESGLGLPDRDYYLRDDPALTVTRTAYKKYLTDMMTLAGFDNAEARAEAVYKLEYRLAEVHWPRADRRNRDKVYNPMPYSGLKKLAPQFPWDAFFAETGVPLKAPNGEREVVVREVTAFPKIAEIFASTPVSVLRDYLTVHYLHSYAAYLPERFDNTDFAFYGTELTGNPQKLDRPTRGVRLLDSVLGEALGKLYVAEYFPPESKVKVQALVNNLLKVYEGEVASLTWMSDTTKQKAQEKIRAFRSKIGYPDKWRDYSDYVVNRDDLIGDVQRGQVFEWNRDLKRLDRPVDKAEWGMTPQTVNAYYSPPFNEIVFPAAILQAPFFDPAADDAVNYGGIGAVIGHEISHGFDDQGSKYTGKGVFESWWTAEDRKNFDSRAAMIVAQYDAFEPLPGLHVIGRNTLGENIADISGLSVALKAYHLSLEGKPAPVRDGFTGDQRFFLSYGQIWRSKFREGALRTRTLSNEHTVDQFRVIGATRDTDAWYDAFGVKPGDKYYLPPDQRVRLW